MNMMNGIELAWTPRAKTRDFVSSGLNYEEMRAIVASAIRRGAAIPGPICRAKREDSPKVFAKVDRVCTVCATPYVIATNQVAQCCSQKCTQQLKRTSALARSTLRTACELCGTLFDKRAHNGRFCNSLCAKRHSRAQAKVLRLNGKGRG